MEIPNKKVHVNISGKNNITQTFAKKKNSTHFFNFKKFYKMMYLEKVVYTLNYLIFYNIFSHNSDILNASRLQLLALKNILLKISNKQFYKMILLISGSQTVQKLCQ